MKVQRLPNDVLDQLRDVVLQHTPRPLVIAVVAGSPEDGLALSMWSAFEGSDAETLAGELLEYSLHAPPI